MQKKEKESSLFLIILFIVIIVLVLLFPKIYSFIEDTKLPQVEQVQNNEEKEAKVIDDELLDSIHYPIMRSSIYSENTYYSLNTFKVSDMSNQDVLYNAFIDIEEINIHDSDIRGNCTNIRKEIDSKSFELRIRNILGKSVKYTFEDFNVPEDSSSNYKGNWKYSNNKFIYNGICNKQNKSTRYYDLEEFIKAEYDGNDVVVYYYVGFAKVEGNNYAIYKDANMTLELLNGEFISENDLNNIFKSIKNKNIYKYTFKNTLCTYDEYCLYEGKWVDKIK